MTVIETLRAAIKFDINEAKVDLLKWVIGLIAFQTLAILGGVVALQRMVAP